MGTYLKWVGNKSKMLKHICSLFPDKWGSYFEPFAGSGAVFFHVCCKFDEGMFKSDKKYYLSDINKYLINCHIIVRDQLDALKEQLLYFDKMDSKEFFIEERKRTFDNMVIGKDVYAAARSIYFNRRAYGGMWRENRDGMFNVPFDKNQKSPLWNKNIENCSMLLRHAKISSGTYDQHSPSKGDFFFLDPPYYPLSLSAGFTSYSSVVWDENSHQSFFKFCKNLDKMGVLFMMTNNDCPAVRKAMDEYNMKTFETHRFIDALTYGNKKKNKRDIVNELVVRNY